MNYCKDCKHHREVQNGRWTDHECRYGPTVGQGNDPVTGPFINTRYNNCYDIRMVQDGPCKFFEGKGIRVSIKRWWRLTNEVFDYRTGQRGKL